MVEISTTDPKTEGLNPCRGKKVFFVKEKANLSVMLSDAQGSKCNVSILEAKQTKRSEKITSHFLYVLRFIGTKIEAVRARSIAPRSPCI